MGVWSVRLGLVCFALALVGCGAEAPSDGSTGRLAITADAAEPLRRGVNAFVVEVRDAERPNAAVDGAFLDVVTSMPSMGHGSPAVPKVRALGDGRYHVDPVVFDMPGTWEVRYRVTAGEVYDVATFRYEVP